MFGKKKVNMVNQVAQIEEILQTQVKEITIGQRNTFESELPEFKNTFDAFNQLIKTDSGNAELVVQAITHLLNDVTEMTYVKRMVQDVNTQTDIVEVVAASSQEMASTIEDMSHFVQNSATDASETIMQTNKSVEAIQLTLEESTKAIEGFKLIKEQIAEVSSEMHSINEMVNIIKGIADQTNLLALNASIEAARAGDAGRGFAVVADEIKKLAETTKESVEFIEKTTVNLSKGMDQTTAQIDVSDKQFIKSNEQLEGSIGSITEISNSVNNIYQNMMQISANIEEQTAASEEIASSMTKMLESSHALKNECDKTGEGLYALSVNMDKVRIDAWNQLRAQDSLLAIEVCVTDHLIWTWRVYNMILGYSKIDVNKIGDHLSCRLGKWLHTLDRSDSKIASILSRMDNPHSSLHECAKNAVVAYNRGEIETADRMLLEMSQYSERVIACLNDLRVVLK